MVVTPGPTDSYSGLERRLKAPVQRGQAFFLGPLVTLLQRLGVSPHAVSAFQIVLGLILLYVLPRSPHCALFLWVVALLSDSVDGMLARRLQRASQFGALWDQTCDHVREILVVAALAHHGVAGALWATLYALAYPAFNLALLLCNRHSVPLSFAVKTYLVFYPALIAYLGWGVNYVTPALAIATLAMATGTGIALRRLYSVMG
jgi:phosphatidylglycerophosphate synthase